MRALKKLSRKDFSILIRDNTRREFGAYKDLSQLNSTKAFTLIHYICE